MSQPGHPGAPDREPVLCHDERVMGTVVSFDVRPGPVPLSDARLALRRACVALARADAVFSLWKPDSPMSRLRRGELAQADAPPEVAEVLARCALARHRSAGWFDPWAMPGGLDPTGLVKGWAARRALEVLVAAGVAGAMVNAGGDVATAGSPAPGEPWRIGVTDPGDRSRLLCVVASPGAVATSGTYERGPHIIDPFRGLPRTRWRSATVMGPELDLADALATGLCAAGAAGAQFVAEAAGYTAVVVDDLGRARVVGEAPIQEPAGGHAGENTTPGRALQIWSADRSGAGPPLPIPSG
ncbi:MAG TPA: FAD:protein FMN transferase [Acidimicrobiales bacterium]|nr:FAD:protein FMN transferase [Acidimicrobiales bacterium]